MSFILLNDGQVAIRSNFLFLHPYEALSLKNFNYTVNAVNTVNFFGCSSAVRILKKVPS